MTRLSLKAPAKINLVLEVLRRRPDGYHDIRTVMHCLELADTLTVTARRPGLRVSADHPGVPEGAGNLVYRAAEALAEKIGRPADVHIHITKRIPVAAGLGGGSSDAAAALLGLNRFWNLRLPYAQLHALAATLGSDVPFFLRRGCALGTGRGERLTAWPTCPGLPLVIVNPGFPVSTAEVYQQVNLQLTTPKNYIKLIRLALKEKSPIKISQNLYNHLEQVTETMHPVISRIKAGLLENHALGALMSGSGPTVFGLMPSVQAGRAAVKALKRQYPVVLLTQTAETFCSYPHCRVVQR